MDIIQHESFLQLSAGALIDLLSKNSFYAPEIEIFAAVQSWVKANPGVEADGVLSKKASLYLQLIHFLLLVLTSITSFK